MIDILLQILKFLFKNNTSPVHKGPSIQNKEEKAPEKVKKVYITAQDIITSSGRYPDRAKSPELTKEVLVEIDTTAAAVNALLNELEWKEKVVISSGFRTSASNAATKGAAKKSSHMLGMAVDIVQPKTDNRLGKLIREKQGTLGNQGILARHGVMMEALEATVGTNTSWVHVDRVKRAFRASFEFKP